MITQVDTDTNILKRNIICDLGFDNSQHVLHLI